MDSGQKRYDELQKALERCSWMTREDTEFRRLFSAFQKDVEQEGNYKMQVYNTTSLLLLMLDRELSELEKERKTGKPYWRRLRVRKRLIQSILEYASLEPKERTDKLREEFFQTRDEDLVGLKKNEKRT